MFKSTFLCSCYCLYVVLSTTMAKLWCNLIILSASVFVSVCVCAGFSQEHPKRKLTLYKMSMKRVLSTPVPSRQTPLTAPEWTWSAQVSMMQSSQKWYVVLVFHRGMASCSIIRFCAGPVSNLSEPGAHSEGSLLQSAPEQTPRWGRVREELALMWKQA